MDIRTHEIRNITITPEILKLISEIDEFKGRWKVIESLAPEKLYSLRRTATIESVGSNYHHGAFDVVRLWSSKYALGLFNDLLTFCRSRRHQVLEIQSRLLFSCS